jgi:hypothetical protein
MTFVHRRLFALLFISWLPGLLGSCGPRAPVPVRLTTGGDLRISAPCTGDASGIVASVTGLDGPPPPFIVTVSGDPAFSVAVPAFTTSDDGLTTNGFVNFHPPAGARPGDTFQGIATVRSSDGGFAAASVALRGSVAIPKVTVDRPRVDFGDVPVGAVIDERVRFHPTDIGAARLTPTASDIAPFSLPEGSFASFGGDIPTFIRASAAEAGEFTREIEWVLGPSQPSDAPAECSTHVKTTVHAKFLPWNMGGDGGADAP